MKRSKKILGLMAVMALGILAGCSSVSNAVKPTTKLVASSKNSEQAWIGTYGLKDKDPVSDVFIFKGNKVATYDFPLGAKLSEFKGLSNSQVIKKAKSLNASQAKKLLVHDKSLVAHLKKNQAPIVEEQSKRVKNIVDSWEYEQPSFTKYDIANKKNSQGEKVKVVATLYGYESSYSMSMNTSLEDLMGDVNDLSKSNSEIDISFTLKKPIQTKEWSGYRTTGKSEDASIGTYLVQPGSRKVALDK